LSPRIFLVAVALASAACPPAFAGAPSDAVQFFYDNIGSERLPENRDLFTARAREQLDANGRTEDAGDGSCVDFVMAIDGQDFDEDEVARTLELSEAFSRGDAVVSAEFMNFGEPHLVQWMLMDEDGDGDWKVADISIPNNGWRLSDLECE
jgi:hypothetical protein